MREGRGGFSWKGGRWGGGGFMVFFFFVVAPIITCREGREGEKKRKRGCGMESPKTNTKGVCKVFS